jgi:hypothetical protein
MVHHGLLENLVGTRIWYYCVGLLQSILILALPGHYQNVSFVQQVVTVLYP